MGQNRFRQYKILDRLGKGGSSEVFSARGPWEEVVALKIQRRPRKRAQFQREFELLNQPIHPQLVKMYEYGMTDEGWSYLIMECLTGTSATTYARSFYGRKRIWRSVSVAAQVSSAVGSLHDRGWIHGDLKSKNIIVDKNDRAVLIDFELARELTRTGTGKFFGTRSYAPPEQHAGEPLTPSVDVYSMAGVLCRMITNRLPFKTVEREQQAHMRRTTKPHVSARVPEPLRGLLLRALSADPAERPRNGHQFAEELLSCVPPEYLPTPPRPAKTPAIIPLITALNQNNLAPQHHLLELVTLTGSDPTLAARFAYSMSSSNSWVPDDFEEQVRHYLAQLPTFVQDALLMLSLIGGCATTNMLAEFTNSLRDELISELQQLPHWLRKEKSRWHLYVGALHPIIRVAMGEHVPGALIRIQQLEQRLPRWTSLFVAARQSPQEVLVPFRQWIIETNQGVLQWRLLSCLKDMGIETKMLEQLLLFRRSGEWYEALRIQQHPQATRLLAVYHAISPEHIPEITTGLRSNNVDVMIVCHALLAEWKLLQGEFQEAEQLLYRLCKENDPYPKIIGQQQRALLSHHLHQRTRFSNALDQLTELCPFDITEQIYVCIEESGWLCNLFNEEHIDSHYLRALKSLRDEDLDAQPSSETAALVKSYAETSSIADRAVLACHPQWSRYKTFLELPAPPTDEEYLYPFEPSEE